MRISRLVVDNFRSIARLDIELPQVGAIIGPNNAGKSNLLLAIQRILGRDWVRAADFDAEDVYGADPDKDVRIAVTFDPPLTYQRFKGAPPASIATLSFEYTRYKIGPQKGQRRLEQMCLDAAGKPVSALARAPKKGEKHQYQVLIGIPSEVREQVPLIFIGTHRSLESHLPGARFSLLRQLFEDVNRDFSDPSNTIALRGPGGTTVAMPRRDRFRELMEAVVSVLRTKSFNDLESSIRRHALSQLGFDPEKDTDKLDLVFSPIDSMDFYKALDLQVREGKFTISATNLGEGVQNALVLAILQVFEERRKRGAILLIEEPEMFLHPQMQRSLAKTLQGIGATNQVLYTTHSPHFVTIPEYPRVLLVRRGTQGTSVRRSSLPLDARRSEKLLKEFDPERNELFFASRLLLVEGDTEKLALPEYARRLGHDLDRAGTTIVEVGGKRNLMEFAQIAKSFAIPTGVIYDRDSSDFATDRPAEAEYNQTLNALATADGTAKVWVMEKDYEDTLKKTLGEKAYQEICAKYPGYSKAVRHRLIATDASSAIPEQIKDALAWATQK